MIEKIESNLQIIVDFIETIKRGWYIITHPIVIWHWLMDVSYWIVSITSVICILYYAVTGHRKPLRIMNVIILTYIILKGVNAAL